MAKHYVYGSGMSGCLFDNGPHVADSHQEAIDALLETFEESISDDEAKSMRRHLQKDLIHTFRNPAEAGAGRAEIDECECDNPKQHDPEYEASEPEPELSDFVIAYLAAAIWTGTAETEDGNSGEPLDKFLDISLDYSPDVIGAFAPEAVEQAKRECADFQEANAEDLQLAHEQHGYDVDNQGGHDFWLTRNRHGVGFWDRGLGPIGDRLTQAAHAYGSSDAMLGDDRKVHLS